MSAIDEYTLRAIVEMVDDFLPESKRFVIVFMAEPGQISVAATSAPGTAVEAMKLAIERLEAGDKVKWNDE